MKLEEMIEYVKRHNHNDEITEALVAALHAADGMRELIRQNTTIRTRCVIDWDEAVKP